MPTTAFITHPDCALHDMGEYHVESPERLRAILVHLAQTGLLARLDQVLAPACIDPTPILRAHNAKLWNAIVAKAPATGHAGFDNETIMCPSTLRAIQLAVGGTIEAITRVCGGKNGNAFVAVRPPGHHATRQRAMGFCFVNNVVIGAYHALAHCGVTRVAIVDIDVHHGNGTEHIIADDTRIYMVSTFGAGIYPGNGLSPMGANMVNAGLTPALPTTDMRHIVTDQLIPALDAFAPELVLVSAGYDAHADDPVGNQQWQDEDYAWWFTQLQEVANRHAQGRLVAVLEGGYNPDALARSVEQSIRAMQVTYRPLLTR